jgi:hypothetical protein
MVTSVVNGSTSPVPAYPPGVTDVMTFVQTHAPAWQLPGHVVGTHWPHALHASSMLVDRHWIALGVHTGGAVQEHASKVQVELHDCVPYVLQTRPVAPAAQGPVPVHDPACQVLAGPQVGVSVPQLPHGAGASVWPARHSTHVFVAVRHSGVGAEQFAFEVHATHVFVAVLHAGVAPEHAGLQPLVLSPGWQLWQALPGSTVPAA